MRFKGKKPIFNYEDTFSLDITLAPVICEGLKKFREVFEDRNIEDKCYGVPWSCYERVGASPEYWEDEKDNEDVKLWFDIIDKMIYAFESDNGPNIKNYSFDIEMIPVDDPEGRKRYTIEVTGRDEEERYRKDLENHEEKIDEGLKLFAEHFKDLWW